ncbi:MAG: flagellar motor switch protein FliG [Proteobacteria bacterium]|nr:MAG: flagellar motor switch protein FliG [Pseudomonadota bacterium]
MAEQKGFGAGTERAAILLMAVGETHAAEVLKHMGPKEVQKLGMAMTQLSNVSKDEVSKILGEFVEMVDNQTALGVGTEDYVRNVLVSALGEEKAGGLIDRILLGSGSKGLDSLKWMDPRAVAELIRLEHPQIIAIVLAYLDADQASDILKALPDRLRYDVVMRIAAIDGIQPSALRELDQIMEKSFSNKTNVKTSTTFGGIKAAADILNLLDSSVENALMEEIKNADADLGQAIQDKMFVFENLVDVDDRGIQTLLREISSDALAVALKGADEGVKEKIFKNMSKRAAEMLRDDLEVRGPVKLSDVEAAQKEILMTARRLADSGEISLGGKGEAMV